MARFIRPYSRLVVNCVGEQSISYILVQNGYLSWCDQMRPLKAYHKHRPCTINFTHERLLCAFMQFLSIRFYIQQISRLKTRDNTSQICNDIEMRTIQLPSKCVNYFAMSLAMSCLQVALPLVYIFHCFKMD